MKSSLFFFSVFKERLKSLYALVHEIENERQKGEHTLESISKTHDKINQEGRLTPYNQVSNSNFLFLFELSVKFLIQFGYLLSFCYKKK